jgi:hypothetical protein
MLQDYVTPWPLALVVSVNLACLAALITVLRSAPSDVPGWRAVGPGGTHWFCFVGCWAFATLISWVWLFVGSGRQDAEVQMRYALMLIFAFGGGAAWSGFYIARLRRMALRWRGTTIRWYGRGGEIVQDMGDFDAFRHAISGALHLRFRDGATLKLDLYSRNAEELAAAISERAGVDID